MVACLPPAKAWLGIVGAQTVLAIDLLHLWGHRSITQGAGIHLFEPFLNSAIFLSITLLGAKHLADLPQDAILALPLVVAGLGVATCLVVQSTHFQFSKKKWFCCVTHFQFRSFPSQLISNLAG